MKDGLAVFLRSSAAFEIKDEHLRHFDRISPYFFRTPTPMSCDQLDAMGHVGALLVEGMSRNNSVHIVGVASRGIPFATAVTMSLCADNRRQIHLSLLGKDGGTEHLARDPDSFTVVIDNAIVSGLTMSHALESLRLAGTRVDLVLSLFDREELDPAGSEPRRRLEVEFDCRVEFLYSLRDVIVSGLDAHQRSILVEYARRFGTKSLREFVNGPIG